MRFLLCLTGWVLAIMVLMAFAVLFGYLINDDKLWPMAIALLVLAIVSE